MNAARRPWPVVAIDGPAGVGKSTTARLLAQRLGFTYVDTGALYRAVAWAARQAAVSWEMSRGLVRLMADLDLRLDTQASGATRLWIDGQDRSARYPRARHQPGRLRGLPPSRRAAGPPGAPTVPRRPGELRARRARHRHRGVSRRRGQGLPDRPGGGACPPTTRRAGGQAPEIR